MDELFLKKELDERKTAGALRSLRLAGNDRDYFSNDYLGLVKNGLIENVLGNLKYAHGSAGSRLLAGNHALTVNTEAFIANFHQAAAALVFNSGYDANFGLLSCVLQKQDLVLYDKLCHASIRDGIRYAVAQSFSFSHNDLSDLEKKLKKRPAASLGNCFVITESVFSMDGDLAPLKEISNLCEQFEAGLIVDEAHATGVIGNRGEGVVQLLGLENKCFARIHTFGKALGCHGAVILGSENLKQYLINFCRPFIYSTALPPSSVAAIRSAYEIFPGMSAERDALQVLSSAFNHSVFRNYNTPIQCFIMPGNENVKQMAELLSRHQFDVRPILYPTVAKGEERLRITLHSFNTMDETEKLVSLLLNASVS